jgi:hypothetical protein
MLNGYPSAETDFDSINRIAKQKSHPICTSKDRQKKSPDYAPEQCRGVRVRPSLAAITEK